MHMFMFWCRRMLYLFRSSVYASRDYLIDFFSILITLLSIAYMLYMLYYMVSLGI